MIKKILMFLVILNLFFIQNISSAKINIDKIYDNFLNRIEKDFFWEKKIIYLENIWKTFEKIYKKSDKIYIKNFLERLIFLNNKELKSLKPLSLEFSLPFGEKEATKEKPLSPESSLPFGEKGAAKENNIEKILEVQKKLEENILENFSVNNNLVFKEHILNLKNNGFEIIFLNEKFEFKSNQKIFRANFKEFYSPLKSNYKLLLNKNKNSKIFVKNKKYFFVENYILEEKIAYSNSKKYFKKFVTKNTKSFLKESVYYFYDFENFFSSNDKYGFYISDLEKNNFTLKNTLLYFNENNFSFVKNYKVHKLISENIIKNIKNKEKFLNIIIEDKKYFKNDDYDNLFLELKKSSENLTKNFSREEKIEIIYFKIIKKLKYFTWDYRKKREVFSWILSNKNIDSVCDWYVKLFAYMLMFSGIEDFEIKKWYVFNSRDFPNIWHAWLKIWEKYYDPTFDDPIGNNDDIKISEFLYFWLKKDLFYTNRFDYIKKDIFTKYKKISLKKREEIVERNLYNLSEKYKNTNLIKTISYKKELWFEAWEKITVEKLKNKLSFIKVKKYKNTFSFVKNNKKNIVTKIKYFNISDKNAENLLKQLKKDFKNSYLLEYKTKSWKVNYYLAFVFEYK